MKGKVCTDTEPGYYSPEGELTQTACPAGTYSGAGASSCTAAAAALRGVPGCGSRGWRERS